MQLYFKWYIFLLNKRDKESTGFQTCEMFLRHWFSLIAMLYSVLIHIIYFLLLLLFYMYLKINKIIMIIKKTLGPGAAFVLEIFAQYIY